MNLCGCVKEQPQTFYHKKEDIVAQKILPGTGGEHRRSVLIQDIHRAECPAIDL